LLAAGFLAASYLQISGLKMTGTLMPNLVRFGNAVGYCVAQVLLF